MSRCERGQGEGVSILLNPEAQKRSIASLRRFCEEELEVELSDLQAASLLSFFLKEVGPSVYNTGIADAQTFLRDRLSDLEATCYEPEFVYWPKGSSVRRKR
jgi:uncharacterized protein (DUF2164 family)